MEALVSDPNAAERAVFVDVLDAVSSEAAIARERFERLQAIMGELVSACPPERRAEAIADVQLVDVLAQHMEALSVFAGELARRTGGDGALQVALQVRAALDTVTLAEVRSRLTRLCDDPDHPHHPVPVETGELDLF
jgi:hypothetical protein